MCTCDKITKREEGCGITQAKVRRQELFTDVCDGDLDVRVKCRVGFKKPGDAEPKDFVSVDLAENVGTIVNALGANFVDFDVLDEESQAKAVKPLNAFDVLMKAANTRTHRTCLFDQ